jgi:hypothetical protein
MVREREQPGAKGRACGAQRARASITRSQVSWNTSSTWLASALPSTRRTKR